MPTRVLYLTAQMPWGAGESFLLEEMRQLSKQGIDLLVSAVRPTTSIRSDEFEALGIASLYQPLLGFPVFRAAVGELVRSPRKVLKMFIQSVLRAENPRHMFRNLAVFPKGLWLAGILREGKFGHLHVHWVAQQATCAWVAASITGVPWSFTAHRWDIADGNLLLGKLNACTNGRVISSKSLEMFLSWTGGVGEEKLSVIHMGVEVPEVLSNGSPPVGEYRLLSVGNLVEVKGHRFLIEAVAKMRRLGLQVTLDILGEGPLRVSLEEQIRTLHLDGTVTLWGSVPHDEVMALMRQGVYSALVHPSIQTVDGVHEGIPVVLMEAMASGLPVVSTETGGIPELLSDGAGVLVPPADTGALEAALLALIHSPDLWLSLRSRAYEHVRSDFNSRKTAELLSTWFRDRIISA